MSSFYKGIIKFVDNFVPKSLRPLWEHPVGPKTIFFWAPIGKWSVVIAGLGDINGPAPKLSALVLASLDAYTRPLDKVSTTQSATLSATGLIWTRYCLVITPVNYSLAICNFMLGVANGVQTIRAYRYQSQKAIA
ncbi:hypothetical protein PYW08_008797 [Mythimna loreyi]|uniref:Uncharacterized protein n=1 Tax=Mythimna loreyi TaxID=667449 RepID=A0ACC2Q9L9_9NEOP|nr:hypothetical protein PYW08_008797 [Mythimna loreyi]